MLLVLLQEMLPQLLDVLLPFRMDDPELLLEKTLVKKPQQPEIDDEQKIKGLHQILRTHLIEVVKGQLLLVTFFF